MLSTQVLEDPIARDSALYNLNDFLSPILAGIESLTGCMAVMSVVGPMGCNGGDIAAMIFAHNVNQEAVPKTLFEWMPRRVDAWRDHLKQYGYTYFSPADMERAKLPSGVKSAFADNGPQHSASNTDAMIIEMLSQDVGPMPDKDVHNKRLNSDNEEDDDVQMEDDTGPARKAPAMPATGTSGSTATSARKRRRSLSAASSPGRNRPRTRQRRDKSPSPRDKSPSPAPMSPSQSSAPQDYVRPRPKPRPLRRLRRRGDDDDDAGSPAPTRSSRRAAIISDDEDPPWDGLDEDGPGAGSDAEQQDSPGPDNMPSAIDSPHPEREFSPAGPSADAPIAPPKPAADPSNETPSTRSNAASASTPVTEPARSAAPAPTPTEDKEPLLLQYQPTPERQATPEQRPERQLAQEQHAPECEPRPGGQAMPTLEQHSRPERQQTPPAADQLGSGVQENVPPASSADKVTVNTPISTLLRRNSSIASLNQVVDSLHARRKEELTVGAPSWIVKHAVSVFDNEHWGLEWDALVSHWILLESEGNFKRST
ncbi:hypothetical protein CYLTODRAFT_287463, partial [Cylindrobasidium torrendii FP15055 ss-10]